MEDRHDQEEIYSQRIKAGKRTYFFDVKATRGQDYYLTITESKRRLRDDDTFSYEKHKIFLYKEDFLKFVDALQDAVDYVRDELLTPEEVAELDRPPPRLRQRKPRRQLQPRRERHVLTFFHRLAKHALLLLCSAPRRARLRPRHAVAVSVPPLRPGSPNSCPGIGSGRHRTFPEKAPYLCPPESGR